MKIGYLFKYRHNGAHEDVTLILLYDYNKKERFLYNINYGVRVGAPCLFYAKHIGKATMKQINYYTEKSNATKK